MKFSEIWYVDASQQKKYFKNFFWISAFFGRFLTKKQPKKHPKFAKNEENWQNSNYLMKLSEIWYVDTSQQKKILQKTIFGFWALLAKKQPKLTKNEENMQNTIRLIKFS